MQETPQEYSARMLGNVGGKDPLKIQAVTAKKLHKLVKRASPSKLRKKPAPEKWSAVEILAHLADVEIVVGWRVRSILGAPGTPIQAFDQDTWAAVGKYSKRDAKRSLADFAAVREANLRLYKSLSPEQRKQFGMHSERGEESVEHIWRMMAGHDLNHLRQIESLLNAKR